jgi:hypothetical protein
MMTRKQMLKNILITGLVFLAIGGWFLHLRIHPPSKNEANWVPFVSGVFSVFILPALFYFRKTLTLAYITNGFLVIIGTITMAHFSIAHFKPPVTLYGILFNTILGDILLLWGKFFVGMALFDLEFLKTEAGLAPKGRYFRYPNMGWWLVHLVTLAVLYALGNIFWK